MAGGWFYVSVRVGSFCSHTFDFVSTSRQTAQMVGSFGTVGSSIALDFIFGHVFECRMIYPPNTSLEPTWSAPSLSRYGRGFATSRFSRGSVLGSLGHIERL